MIYDITQTLTNFNLQWIITSRQNKVCVVNAPYNGRYFEAFMIFSNNTRFRLYFNTSDKKFGSSLKDLMSFKIFDDKENLIGRVVGETHKTPGKLFGGYLYYELTLYNSHFVIYEVGRGAEGIALCIYENDKLVAICDKNPRVTNFKDRYKIYTEESKYLYIAALFDIYYDMARNADMREIKLYSDTVTYTVNSCKEVASQYDPDFISRIVQQDNAQ